MKASSKISRTTRVTSNRSIRASPTSSQLRPAEARRMGILPAGIRVPDEE